MRRFAAILCLAGAFLFALGKAGSAQNVDSEELLGGHENPPVISDGTGDFMAQLDQVDRIPFQMTYDIGAEGSAPEQAHLHIANPGNNGGIVVFLCSNVGNTPVGAQVRPCPPSPTPRRWRHRGGGCAGGGRWRAAHRDPDHRGRRSRGLEAPDRAGRGLRERAHAGASNRRDPRSASRPAVAAASAPQVNAPALSDTDRRRAMPARTSTAYCHARCYSAWGHRNADCVRTVERQ